MKEGGGGFSNRTSFHACISLSAPTCAASAGTALRRLWMMLKERHPDWTVPEGRVHRALARLRADARAVEEQAAGAAAAMAGGASGTGGGGRGVFSPSFPLPRTNRTSLVPSPRTKWTRRVPHPVQIAGHPTCACSIQISRESCLWDRRWTRSTTCSWSTRTRSSLRWKSLLPRSQASPCGFATLVSERLVFA